MIAVWLLIMGPGVLVSLATFFLSSPEGAPQQAVVGIWSLYYLILPYTICRAIEGMVLPAGGPSAKAKAETSG